jgi:glycosyltransferase involved in cell wall biosynthesis
LSNTKKAKIKICIVTSSLGKGGGQKSSAVLSILLDSLGYDVHIVSILDTIDYAYKGTLLNLGILKKENDSFFGKIKRFYVFFYFIRTQNFDFIIDSRSRPSIIKQFLINKLIYVNQKVIFIVHSFFLEKYIPKNKCVAQYLYRKAYKFVTVSHAIKFKLLSTYHFDNVHVVHNAVNEVHTKSERDLLVPKDDYILFFGRIEDSIKNLTLLIESYKLSVLRDKNIKLVILGEGSDKLKLKQKVQAMDINKHVLFLPYTKNPYPVVSKAMFTILTSKYEGFPTMLIESLSQGTPVISVNCQSGPSEIITEAQNGLLVANNNPDLMAEAMNRFVTDNELYEFCKNNAKMSVEKFNIENISNDWKQLIESV